MRLVIRGRGVGTLCIILALLPSLHGLQDGLVGVRIPWTQQPVLHRFCKGLVPF